MSSLSDVDESDSEWSEEEELEDVEYLTGQKLRVGVKVAKEPAWEMLIPPNQA